MSNLNSIKMLLRNDFEEAVKLNGVEIPCYSKKDLDNMYPNDNWIVVGETKAKNKKKARSELFLADVISKDKLDLDDAGNEIPFKVSRAGTHSKLLYKRAGYIPVDTGADNYVALLKFRAAFIFWLILLIGAIVGVGIALFTLLGNQPDDDLINIMPPVDSSQVRDETDNEEEFRPIEEGGYISMSYKLEAALNLSTGKIKMYFRNPGRSNENVSVALYVVNGKDEYLIATSGVIQPGYKLTELDYKGGNIVLGEGIYNCKYLVSYYNPKTGERAVVESEIVNVKLSVNQ